MIENLINECVRATDQLNEDIWDRVQNVNYQFAVEYRDFEVFILFNDSLICKFDLIDDIEQPIQNIIKKEFNKYVMDINEINF